LPNMALSVTKKQRKEEKLRKKRQKRREKRKESVMDGRMYE